MRALVTGASGFVGRFLVDALRHAGAEVLPCSGPHDGRDQDVSIDLNDMETLRAALASFQPTVIFHLAAQTFVPQSLRSPIDTYEINALGTARLAEAVRDYGGRPRLLFTSSAAVYGNRDPADYPLQETLDPRPSDPYGASKAAAEVMLLAESRCFGLDVVIARAFNHIGPGQAGHFVIASLAKQLAAIASGGSPQLLVGNLSAARDFLDVRDVVAAYVALARDGETGQIYNVCSGRAIAIRDALRELILISRVAVEVREDPERMRSVDAPIYVGSPKKLEARTGWRPAIPLVQSLRDVYQAALSLLSC